METELPPLVLLAGGRSSRRSESKGLADFAGQPFILWQLARFAAAGGRGAVVVLGHEAGAFRTVLAGVQVPKLTIAVNPDPERGSFSSLICGLAEITESAFVLPIDVPAPAPEVWRALAAALKANRAIMPTFDDRGGHPVLLSAAFGAALQRIPLDAPEARLDRQLAGCARIPVNDPAVRANLNTDAEWQAWVSAQKAPPR